MKQTVVMTSVYIIIILAVCCQIWANEYYISGGMYVTPPVKFDAIHPKGFKVSALGTGYVRFMFRGNVNRQLNFAKSTKWNVDSTAPMNVKWVFEDSNTELKIGDVIYYWTYVQTLGGGQSQGTGAWTVTEYVDKDGLKLNSAPLRIAPSPQPIVTTTETCLQSQTAVFGRTKVCQGELIFKEEFDKNGIEDLLNWNPEVNFPQEPDYPFNVYMVDNALTLEDGDLVVSPSLLESKFHEGILYERLDLTNTCTGQIGTRECSQVASGAQILPPVITGKITTKNKFSFKFGVVEIRAKLPSGDWLIPEITLEPRDAVYGSQHYESGLIRVAFVKGNAVFGKRLYGGPVLSDTEPYRSYLMKEKLGSDNWFNDYHNYSLVWQPDSMELFVDGEKYGSVDPGDGFLSSASQFFVTHAATWSRGTMMAPVDEMFYVALGLRVGGVNDFVDSSDKPWRNKRMKARLDFWNAKDTWFSTWDDAGLKVDYVKIYAL